jgi:DNA helicase HerA-like ATPase
MFGKILGIDDNLVKVENKSKKLETGIIGIHVVFLTEKVKYVGVVKNITEDFIFINLIGEIKNNIFTPGVVKKPNAESSCRIIAKQELESILGNQNYINRENLLIGNSEIYDNFKVTVREDDFFTSHFAIVGNTGSGKSCGMARLLQNLFFLNDREVPKNSHFVIFDAFNDYSTAFAPLNNHPDLSFKNLVCDLNNDYVDNVKIPAYFLDVDDIAILLDVNDPTLIPTITNTLRIVYIFTSSDAAALKYKNSIIASCLLDILSSGKNSTQIRDQIVAVLSKFNTPDINLESIIAQPGYDRTLRQCLLIDNQGKINAINLVVDFVAGLVNKDLDNVEIQRDFVYTLDNLYNALEFSLINEGILSANVLFDKLNSLKVRLRAIMNSDLKKVFEFDRVITKDEFVREFFKKGEKQSQIVGVNFGNLDDRTVKMLTKILSKIFFQFTVSLEDRTTFPIHIIIEEAHRYVQDDSDVKVLGYNIFERITKEGRKYGIFLGIITQRPTELSSTVLSQCGNFIAFKMYYLDDIEVVTSLSTSVTEEMKEKLKLLHPGMALCFGNSFSIPLVVQFDLPDPMPVSTDVAITSLWY